MLLKNQQKSSWLNILQTWIPMSPRHLVEKPVHSKLSVRHSAEVRLCGTTEVQPSKEVAVPRCAAQWSAFLLTLLTVLGIANNFRFHTFATKASGFKQFHLTAWHWLKVHHLDKRPASAEENFSSGVGHPQCGRSCISKLNAVNYREVCTFNLTEMKRFPKEKWPKYWQVNVLQRVFATPNRAVK